MISETLMELVRVKSLWKSDRNTTLINKKCKQYQINLVDFRMGCGEVKLEKYLYYIYEQIIESMNLIRQKSFVKHFIQK